MSEPFDDTALADLPTASLCLSSQLLAKGFLPYERHLVDVGDPDAMKVDVLRGGHVVGVLPIDLSRGGVVLLRQFRYPAQLAAGRGDLVEMVAGRVEPGESPKTAAGRECLEEIGTAPTALAEMFSSMPSPGITDEIATLYAGFVDSSKIIPLGGTDPHEHIRPRFVTFGAALEALDRGAFLNGLLIQGLYWLAVNRARLPALAVLNESPSRPRPC